MNTPGGISETLPFAPRFCGLSEQIADHARFRADEPALVEGDHMVTWKAYDRTGNRIGHALKHAGVSPGDRVAMLVSNHVWAHEVLLGIWRAGAVAVPLSPMLDEAALQRMIADCGARLLFSSAEFSERAGALVEGGLDAVVEGEVFDHWVSAKPAESTGVCNGADDLALIIYSSGTTGVPKGIAHSHASRLSFASGFATEFGFNCHSVALSCVPLHSNGAWLSWSPAKWVGAVTVILPVFTAEGFVEAVGKHRPTHGFIVPTMAAVLLMHPGIEHAGLECFETAITAGSPMPEQTKLAVQQLTGNALYELWGLTEGVATIITPQQMMERLGSVGRPMLGCDIRIIDDQDRDITFRGTGEIVGCSAGMMSGYWNRPDANKELEWTDSEGRCFLRTGDIGEFDEAGFLVLRGRKKDMIISGGLNVYPVDIETVLLGHPGVLDAAVVGFADEKWGEVPVAFVVPANGFESDSRLGETVLAWANERLARHQRISRVVIHDGEFPRNTMGKVMKPELAARL